MDELCVSILMNCYNGELYLREAINSVLTQTYQNWEIIFWDNQSTDSSACIFHEYEDIRLRYFYAPKHTCLYEARNYALKEATGAFIAFLDVDDWWLPNKLKNQMQLFLDPNVGIVCSNYWVKSERKNKIWKSFKNTVPTGWVLSELLKSYFVGLPTLMIRSSALASLGYAFDPRYHLIGDFDLVIRLSIYWKLGYVNQPLACYRVHNGSETSKHYASQINEMESWMTDMKKIDKIRTSANFQCVSYTIIYLKVIHQILQSNKKKALSYINELSWGRLKLRLLFALLLPKTLVR